MNDKEIKPNGVYGGRRVLLLLNLQERESRADERAAVTERVEKKFIPLFDGKRNQDRFMRWRADLLAYLKEMETQKVK